MADERAQVRGDRLSTYRAKRDFEKTPEPAPGRRGRPGGPEDAAAGTFVVQQHAARRMHYDVRLEVDGVLASWAVPNGPSYDPHAKRLAVHVEDHPLDYRDFEGAIPAAEYGGGKVIVWDEGFYANLTERSGRPVPVADAIEQGHLSVWLQGSKLHGGWSLTRTRRPGDRHDNWLMVKRNDERADPSRDVVAESPHSVRSGRRVEEITADDPTWTRARATFVPPMLASLSSEIPAGGGEWLFQRKFDGLRAVAVRNGDEVGLWSRNHLSFVDRFPLIAAAVRDLPVDEVVLDGELVAYEHDHTSFQLLQRAGPGAVTVYEVFDVLHLLGEDTTGLACGERTALVGELLGGSGPAGQGGVPLRAVRNLEGDPRTLLRRACAEGWEGLIAKRAASPYRSGRSRDWRKLKCGASQELVIGGWTPPRGSRRHLGALLVGYYDERGALRYAGKVGSGLDEAALRTLAADLARREVTELPFSDLPGDVARTARFAAPELVASIAFSEWTADGRLRHPRFQGLRPDKAPREVVRERPTPGAPAGG